MKKAEGFLHKERDESYILQIFFFFFFFFFFAVMVYVEGEVKDLFSGGKGMSISV